MFIIVRKHIEDCRRRNVLYSLSPLCNNYFCNVVIDLFGTVSYFKKTFEGLLLYKGCVILQNYVVNRFDRTNSFKNQI